MIVDLDDADTWPPDSALVDASAVGADEDNWLDDSDEAAAPHRVEALRLRQIGSLLSTPDGPLR
jgi:hypothetical protein